jgi:hypothetical protein
LSRADQKKGYGGAGNTKPPTKSVGIHFKEGNIPFPKKERKMKITTSLYLFIKKMLPVLMVQAILFLGFTLFLCGPSFAQLVFSKTEAKHTIKPGQSINDGIKITNTDKVAIILRVAYEDFEFTAPFSGARNFLPPGVLKNSFSRWFNYSPQELIIDPGKSQDFSYSFNVPKNLEDGGYYGLISFESDAFKPVAGARVSGGITARRGILFSLETEKTSRKLTLGAINIVKGKLEGHLNSAGNINVETAGTYYIMSEDGVVTDRGKAGIFYFPPGIVSGTFSIILPVKNIAAGKYTLGVTFDLGAGESLTKEVELSYKAGEGYKIIKVND